MQVIPSDIPEKNPLNFSKIRIRVALFLSSKDCVACMQVSRDWFQDFVRPVWHTIDFLRDLKFMTIESKVLKKYGQFIKRVCNIAEFDHIVSLQHSNINCVTAVSFRLIGDWHYRELVADLVRRCKGQIMNMEIHCPASPVDTVVEQRCWDRHYFQMNTIMGCPLPAKPVTDIEYGLGLRSLDISRSCITREGFSALLQYSPVLQKLKLFQVVVLRYNASVDLFRNSSIISLEAPLSEILMPDPVLPDSPSLLIHMPLLQKWTFTSVERPTAWTSDALRKELSDHCPLLTTFRFDKMTSTTGPNKISEFVLKCTQKLESCMFSAQSLDLAMAFACVSHLNTLTSLTITGTLTSLEIASTMEWVYYLPMICSKLKVLSMQELVMDIEEIEKQPWTCLGFQELRLRFKGLESKEEVERCVKQVCAFRRTGDANLTRLKDRDDVVSRVTLHLLKFAELSRLFVEGKEYFLPLSSAL